MPQPPEDNSSTSSSSSSTQKQPRKPRGPFDQGKLDELERTRDIIAAYRDPAHKAKLIARDVTEAEVAAVEATANLAETAITGGRSATVAKEQLTAEETAARAGLIAGIALIQRGALRTFRADQRPRLGDFFVGEELGTNLARLKTIATAILSRLQPGVNNAPPLDVLKGVKAADIANIATALGELTTKDDEQAAAQAMASGERRTADDLIADMVAGRLDIQLAADQEWPWTGHRFDAIRTQFQLPLTRPMTE